MSTADRDAAPPGALRLADPPYWDPFDPRFPDGDGEPMADNQIQYKWMVTIAEGLDALLADRPDVLVACDLLWYFDEDDARRCVAPDVFVAFGRPKALRHSYKEWLEGGPPQVVFEIHSPSNTPARMQQKLELYDARGVEEYYYYFPEDHAGRFDGWVRGPAGLGPLASADGWTSPWLGVTFETPPEDNALVLRGPDGEPFQHVQDIIRDRKLARRVAEIERQRRKEEARRRKEEAHRRKEEARRRRMAEADAVAQRASRERAEADAVAERARADRLAALLREMGVDPD